MPTRIVAPYQRINDLESEVLQRLQANVANAIDPIVALLANKENASLLTGGSNETGASILAKLLTVDGAGSGLDADLLDGLDSTAFSLLAHVHSAADITTGILAVAQGGTGASTLGTSKAIQSSSGGVLEASAVTTAELGHVSGVTSAIQTQLNAKASTSHAADHKDSGSDDLLSAPGAIGATTPATGKFINVEVTGAAASPPAVDTLYQDNIPKGWIKFDGTLVVSPASTTGILDSFNVSSVLDNSTGNYTTAWDRDFTNANYAYSFGTRSEAVAGANFTGIINGQAPTAGAIRTQTWDSAATVRDAPGVCIMAFGDQ